MTRLTNRPALGDPAIALRRLAMAAQSSPLAEPTETTAVPIEVPEPTPVETVPDESTPEETPSEPPGPLVDPSNVDELLAPVADAIASGDESAVMQELIAALNRLAHAVNNIGAMQEWQNGAIAETTGNINRLVNSGNPMQLIQSLAGGMFGGKKRNG